jgi:hypothetical protein
MLGHFDRSQTAASHNFLGESDLSFGERTRS